MSRPADAGPLPGEALAATSGALAACLVVLAFGTGCRGEAPAPVSGPAAAASTAEACAQLETRVAQLETELELRRQDLERAEFELLDTRDELARLREMLRRLGRDAELQANEEGEGEPEEEEEALAAEVAPPPVRRPVPAPSVRPWGAPQVTVGLAGSVIVSGYVVNETDNTENGVLIVTLSGPEGALATSEEVMILAPGARERYDVTFGGIFPTGPIAATAQWSY